MAFPADGLYRIRNIGRNLMLDLHNNNTAEGNQIIGWADNGNLQAQRWILRNQGQPGTFQTVSLQSNNDGDRGNGFFTAQQDAGEPVQYTRIACVVNLVNRTNNNYTISFTRGEANLVLSIPRAAQNDVTLENYTEGRAPQLWEFTKV